MKDRSTYARPKFSCRKRYAVEADTGRPMLRPFVSLSIRGGGDSGANSNLLREKYGDP
jgi:hypothetical protein